MKSESLVGRFRDGNSRALEVLFSRYRGRVERIVYARTGNFLRSREQVADLVQEVLMRMFKDLNSYEVREDARFIDWAATVCERTLRNRARYWNTDKRDPGLERPMDASSSAIGWELVGKEAAPIENLCDVERSQVVDDCLGELVEEQREVILLRSFAGASWDYVAMVLDKNSKAAAEQLFQRARKALVDKVRLRLSVGGES